jgi:hypothetical protein
MRYRLMLGLDTVESVAHVIQVALTPVFLLSGIASLLGVLSTRLARVADRVDALADQLARTFWSFRPLESTMTCGIAFLIFTRSPIRTG